MLRIQKCPFKVTPHVGVWIETLNVPQNYRAQIVTPHVGVWIETKIKQRRSIHNGVTPHVGVWIETDND